MICQLPQIFASMRAAEGATTWQRAAEAVASGTATVSGLSGPATISTDLHTGRFSRVFRINGMGSTIETFDGSTLWRRDISGGVHPLDAAFSRRLNITDAYLVRQGYLDPSNEVSAACVGSEQQGGEDVVIRVQPPGGAPADLTVNVRTHLLASISERLPTTTEVTRFSDYRLVDGAALPFLIESGTQAEPEDGYKFAARTYVFLAATQSGDFAKPKTLNDVVMHGGALSTGVPLAVEGRQLLVWASLNGHAAMPFILDTGGHAILTAKAARELNIQGVGAGVSGGSGAGTVPLQFAHVSSLRIGDAELPNQTFLIIDYPYSFYERGPREPVAGILGLEVFERFAAQIDYGRKRLTLTPFATYHHVGSGAGERISFQDDMPLATAAADGNNGLFGIDTGNAGTVILFGGFLDRTKLGTRYANGVQAQGHGTGGANSGRVVSLHHFSFADRSFANVRTFLTYMKSGSFSSWTEGGNFGYEILSRFVPTFDYAHLRVYLDPSPFAHAPLPNRAGFIADKDRSDVFNVVRVQPQSPAANAGLKVGDQITSIDGKLAQRYSYGDLYDLVTAGPGTEIVLHVVRGTQALDIVVRT